MGQTNSPTEMADAVLPHVPSIWRYALSLSGTRDLADDLTQATVLRAMEKHAQFKDGTTLIAWCLTICRSVWINQLRAQSIRATQSLAAVAEVEDLLSRDHAENRVFAEQVIAEVMALPPAQRETVFLVYVEGFKYSEAAHILDVPIGTIMSRLSAARASLKHLMTTRPNQRTIGSP